MKLYLADDDYEDRELFIEALEELPLDTETSEFENGIELMADLYSDKAYPDAIYLDLHMPMMDGYECLDDIRGVPEFSGIPVIIYSMSYNEEKIENLRKSGADQYLQKPSSFNQLKTLLYKSLKLVADRKAESDRTEHFEILV